LEQRIVLSEQGCEVLFELDIDAFEWPYHRYTW
jgi:hypothetical protein